MTSEEAWELSTDPFEKYLGRTPMNGRGKKLASGNIGSWQNYIGGKKNLCLKQDGKY